MPDPALLHPPGSLSTIPSKSRVGLWACLLAIWIFVFSLACMGMDPFSPVSEKGLGLVPLEGPSQGRQTDLHPIDLIPRTAQTYLTVTLKEQNAGGSI